MARKKRSIINGLGARLKEARESSGWRQIDAAMQLGISESAVCRHETDRAEPDLTDFIGYSEMYRVPIDYLLKGGEMQKKEDPFNGLGLVGRQIARLIIAILIDFGL